MKDKETNLQWYMYSVVQVQLYNVDAALSTDRDPGDPGTFPAVLLAAGDGGSRDPDIRKNQYPFFVHL